MEYEFNLLDLSKLILSKIKIVITSIILFALIFGGVTYYTFVPMYTSYITLYVSSKTTGSTVTINDITLARNIVNTYSVILKSNKVLKTVIEKTGLNLTADQLKKMVKVETVSESEVMKISVTNNDPHTAAFIANAIGETAPNEIIRVTNVGQVQVLDTAEVNYVPQSKNLIRNIIIGILSGAFVSVALILLVNSLDNRLKSAESIEKMFNIPVLAQIPMFDEHDKRGYKYGKSK